MIESPRVGLIAFDDRRRRCLERVLDSGGYRCEVALALGDLSGQLTALDSDVDTWLLDVDGPNIELLLDTLHQHSNKPLLLVDDIPSGEVGEVFRLWQRRLLQKLEVVALGQQIQSEGLHPRGVDAVQADTVWLLAASQGGPEAVCRFLKALPPSLSLAMVYAQHTQLHFDQQLATTVDRAQSYPVQLIRSEQQLSAGNVYVVPVDRQVRFLDHGRTVATRRPWSGIYQPTIDQVLADLARLYRDRFGVIVFSGMCNDSQIGVRVARACGGTVWAQTPGSCVSPSMPQAAIDTGCVGLQGSPEELAAQLAQHCHRVGGGVTKTHRSVPSGAGQQY
jgi:chemosensory pili system protein ChpB (putative protein-glutamate methylesterase)